MLRTSPFLVDGAGRMRRDVRLAMPVGVSDSGKIGKDSSLKLFCTAAVDCKVSKLGKTGHPGVFILPISGEC